MGTRLDTAGALPIFAWLCQPCATEAHREKEAGIRG
jgi:hypothetical protein